MGSVLTFLSVYVYMGTGYRLRINRHDNSRNNDLIFVCIEILIFLYVLFFFFLKNFPLWVFFFNVG